MSNYILELENAVVHGGHKVTKQEALELYKSDPAQTLFAAADRIRKSCCSMRSNICSIINAKQGNCSENCSYCAQSSLWNTSCKTTGMIEPKQAAELCKKAVQNKVSRISLVTSGRGLSGTDFETALECLRHMQEQCGNSISLCASFGIISADKLKRLKEAGVTRYHHNLETGKNYYPKICTTHTYSQRMQTIKNAQACGLELCCGGIIGLGESREDRIDLANEIRELNVQSVPINVLTSIPGTPLENAVQISKEEILRTIAVFRFIMPSQTIRCAAGRRKLGDNGREAFLSGANALISGDFLTTSGSSNEDDRIMLKSLGYETEAL